MPLLLLSLLLMLQLFKILNMGFESKNAQKRQHGYDVDMLQREQQFNAEQSQVAYDRQREFYDYQFSKESAYNSPLAQMQRYKAAGLNPYLMQTDSGNTSLSASSPSSASANGSNTVNMAAFQNNTLSALNNVANIAQGLSQLQSQTDLNKSQEVKNYVDATKTAGVDSDEVKANINKIMQDTQTSKAQELNTIADTELKGEQKKNVAEDTRRLSFMVDKFLPKQYDEIQKNIENIASQIWQRQQVTPAEVARIHQEIAESISNVNVNSSNKALLDKQLDWFDQQAAVNLGISRQQFQQLCSNNMLLNLRNNISADILNTNNVNGLWNDSDFRNNVYKLRALEALTPFPAMDFLNQGLQGVESIGRSFNLFGGKDSGSKSIKGFLR